MGRIKTTLIKRTARKLLNKYPQKFTQDFEQNKPLVHEILPTANKKLRNDITGFLTRIAKQQQAKKI